MNRLEVVELTELLRTDGDFAHLRRLLARQQLRPEEVALGGLIEGEDNSSFGVFVDRAGRCTLFAILGDERVSRWEHVEDPRTLRGSFTAVEMAVSLMLTGHLSEPGC